jgi:hypothetical protein
MRKQKHQCWPTGVLLSVEFSTMQRPNQEAEILERDSQAK